MEKIIKIAVCSFISFMSGYTFAQIQVPVAVSLFAGQESVPHKVSAIVQADLQRSGIFRVLSIDVPTDETKRPDISAIRQIGADAFLTGSINLMDDGRYDLRIRLWDIVRGQDLGAMSYKVVVGDLRFASHKVSDFVYEKLTGNKGVFSTRIAYVTKSGGNRYTLWVADADGQNAQSALSSARLITSPSWNSAGNRLAYVSYESGKADIYIHEVSAGKRRLHASGMSPMWSPDGRYIVYSNLLGSETQIYLIPADSGEAKLINLGAGDNSEPVFSNDGLYLYFAKKLNDRLNIYRISILNFKIEKITEEINAKSPSISVDNRFLAYLIKAGDSSSIRIMDLTSRNILTSLSLITNGEDRPSFSPDGKSLIYIQREGAEDVIVSSHLNGSNKNQVRHELGIPSAPAWGSFLKVGAQNSKSEISEIKNIYEKLKVGSFEAQSFSKEPVAENINRNDVDKTTLSQDVRPQANIQAPNVLLRDKRIALVIGNSNYRTRPLRNPTNDANDVSNALKSSGFQVIDLRDASLQQMRAGVRQFGDRLINNDVGLVYYSGHGVEVKGRNYFIPVNADIQREDEVADQGLDVSLVLEKMSTAGKGVNILIVDACRDDPFGRSFRSSSRGLANMDAPRGTIIAYATSPGKVAQDGDGRNSPYTKNLVRTMQQPNKPIEQVFKEVRRAVQAETKNQQTPWENTSLSGDFYFRVQK